MNYDLLWIAYFIGAGLATFFIFKTNVTYIVFAAIAIELSYFLVYNTSWNFIRRYLFNLLYALSYVTALVFS